MKIWIILVVIIASIVAVFVYSGTYQSGLCSIRGGEVVNTMGKDTNTSGIQSLGYIDGMRCPCECIIFEDDITREQFLS